MKLLSPFWAGVFIAGPLAAIMSTVDSMLLLASAAIIKDLYIHYGLKGDASRMTPARLQTMSLVCTAVIGLIVFAAAIEPPDLLVWINLFAFGGLEAVFLWPIILGLYWKEANVSGAVASIVAGVACFLRPQHPQARHGRHPRHRAHVHRRLRGVRHRREVRPPGFGGDYPPVLGRRERDKLNS